MGPLPGGHPADAGNSHPHRQQRRLPGGPGFTGGAVRHHQRDRPVRLGSVGLQAGAEHLEILPGRVPGPRGGQALSPLQRPQKGAANRPEVVQRLRKMYAAVPYGGHFRSDPDASCH